MTTHEATARRRAVWLLHWYPAEWRARYGEEFVELLVDDIVERPRSMSRAIDIMRGGLVARLAVAGLAGRALSAQEHARRSMAAFGCTAFFFVTVALSLWAQLTIGWQWAPPNTVATTAAMVVMTVAVAAIGLACVACAVPIAWLAFTDVLRRHSWSLLRPLGLVLVGAVVLGVGTHHFANGWPGTGGHPWAHQGIVPGGVAAYAWASTLFVTSYWLHPSALGHFPGTEVAWMIASPLAVVSVVVGCAKVVRRVQFSDRILRFERIVGLAAAVAMAAFLTGAALWVVDGGPGPRNLFHIGSIDVIELGLLAVSLTLAGHAVKRTRHPTPSTPTPF